MATLPIVNQTGSYEKPNTSTSLDKISNSLRKRMTISSKSSVFGFLSKEKNIQSAVNDVKSLDISKRIYTFFINDSIRNEQFQRIDYREKDKEEKKRTDMELSYLSSIAESVSDDKSKNQKGIIDKLMSYANMIGMGMMVYKNWSSIEKLLGLEGIGESIKKLSDDFGITSIFNDIKSAIDDIMGNFKFYEPSLPMGGGPVESSKYDELFRKIGKEEGVDPALLKSIAKAESSFNPKAVSPKGAMGLMQLMPSTAKRFGVPEAKGFEEESNIRGGAKYLSYLHKKYKGDTVKAIAAYNAGEGNVDKYGGIPPFKETQEYVKKVSGFMQETPSQPLTTDVSIPETPQKPSETKPLAFKPESDFSITANKNIQPTTIRVSKRPKEEIKSSDIKTGDNPLDVTNKFISMDENKNADELNSFINQNFGSFDVKKTPWCAAFANSVLQASGYRGTGSASATSFLGLPGIVYDRLKGVGNVQDAKPGDIAVFHRTGGGHVGFVKSVDMNGLTIVGGNQSDKDSGGQVSVSRRDFKDLLGIRRPGDFRDPVLLSEGGIIPPKQTQQPTQQKPKTMVESIQNEMQYFFDLFDQLPSTIKSLEDKIQELSTDIPRKEKVTPVLPSSLQQNNFMLNVNEEKKYIVTEDNSINPNLTDIPPVFANDLLTQYYR